MKIELEGQLLVLVEEDSEGVHITAEICGINIWDWLYQNDRENVKIILEKEDLK